MTADCAARLGTIDFVADDRCMDGGDHATCFAIQLPAPLALRRCGILLCVARLLGIHVVSASRALSSVQAPSPNSTGSRGEGRTIRHAARSSTRATHDPPLASGTPPFQRAPFKRAVGQSCYARSVSALPRRCCWFALSYLQRGVRSPLRRMFLFSECLDYTYFRCVSAHTKLPPMTAVAVVCAHTSLSCINTRQEQTRSICQKCEVCSFTYRTGGELSSSSSSSS